jgi:hypothetical protein
MVQADTPPPTVTPTLETPANTSSARATSQTAQADGFNDACDQPGALSANGPNGAEAITTVTDEKDGFTVWRKEINSGCSFADHSYTIDVTADPADMSEIKYSMSNFDVDYNDPQGCEGGPEVDNMSLNSKQLGVLTGANGSWSINSWSLNKTQVVSGTNTIFIDTDAPGTGCWCVGVGYIEIRAKVGFKVKSVTPQPDDKNRDFHADKLDLTVTFSNDYKPASLTNSTFKVEYRNAAGAWQQVNGDFEQVAPNKFRYKPQGGDLKDGVRYRATVKSGASGVLGKNNEELNKDYQWYFWTVPDLSKNDKWDYGSGSSCVPSTATSTCDGLEVAVFQVAKNAQMVPKKDSVTRLYLRWKKHTDVHVDDLVKELEVDATVKADGKSATLRQTVKRPDRYSAAEKASASNTINLYLKPEAAFSYEAEVTPQPQTNATPVKYTKTNALTSTGKSPEIKFDYYVMQDGSWAGGIPAGVSAAGLALMQSGSLYITDQFPALSTTPTSRGTFTIGYTISGTVAEGSCGTVNQVICPGSGTKSELRCVQEKLLTMRGGNKFVAATVPNNLCIGATAFALGNVFMHQNGTGANDGTIAHEVGHIYGISTANNPNNKHRNNSVGVEGFQVRTKTNRSFTEAPANSISLMHTTLQPLGTQWVHNDDYTTLIGSVSLASFASFKAPNAVAAPPYLIVAGSVNTTTNTVQIYSSFLQDVPNTPPSNAGVCAVELVNGTGTVLSISRFDPGVESVGAEITIPDIFDVSLPWDASAQQLRIVCSTSTLLTQPRSPNAPTADIVGIANGDVLSGSIAFTWTGSDTDGDALQFQPQFSADGTTWSPLAPLGTALQMSLDTRLLPSGAGRRLRVLATDGLNTSYAERTVTISNPLSILLSYPAAGASNIPVVAPVRIRFNSPIDASTVTITSVRVLEGGFLALTGTVGIDSNTGEVVFTPNAPYFENRSYSVRLGTFIRDTAGNSLPAETSYTFTTIPDTTAPNVVRNRPADGDLNVPLNALILAEFNEPMNASTLNTTTLSVQSSTGDVVTGTVSYDSVNRWALLRSGALLQPNTTYIGSILTDVKDLAGNALAAPNTWSFTTGDVTTTNGLRIIGNFSDQPLDTNGDGLYDLLQISAEVEVLQAGNYNLNGRLLDALDQLIEWETTGSRFLQPGVHRLVLGYRSVPIRSNGIDGPYTLDALNFYNVSNNAQADVRYNAYQTFPYSVTRFYSILAMGGMPDQLLEWNTTRPDAFKPISFTSHISLPLSSITYRVLVNSDPRISVTLDAEGFIDIIPDPDTEAESDVTVEARDTLGNRVVDTFHISVQKAQPSLILASTAQSLPIASNRTITVALSVYDQFSRIVTDIVTGTVDTTFGSASPAALFFTNGAVTVTFDPQGNAGAAFLTVRVRDVVKVIQIDVQRPRAANLVATAPTRISAFQTANVSVNLLDQFGQTFTETVTGTAQTSFGAVTPANLTFTNGAASFTFDPQRATGNASIAVTSGGANTIVRIEVYLQRIYLPIIRK